jgi:lipopolysaccharide transport system ATP-binding protein
MPIGSHRLIRDADPADDRLLRDDEFWAVKNVTFELRRGECLGLIGRNGAGKTTLLKMLNGLIKPDSGRITMRGRVGALIALGAGFNPILTGRENIYVNGSILGLSKSEIDNKLEDIISFAEIDEFIDSPVQNYSSGMQIRLGFAVATALNPSVLILDEVLAVGDASFRQKCYDRISSIIKSTAVIFVSHSMEQISTVSTLVGLLKQGELTVYENKIEGVKEYWRQNRVALPSKSNLVVNNPAICASVHASSTKILYGESISFKINIEASEEVDDVRIWVDFKNEGSQIVACFNSIRDGKQHRVAKGRSTLLIHIPEVYLHDGPYSWSCYISKKNSVEFIVWGEGLGVITVESNFPPCWDIPYLTKGNVHISYGD